MGIRFACHHCGRRLNIKRDLAGKRGVCPECEGRFRIPQQDAQFSLDVGTGEDSLSHLQGGTATATAVRTNIALLDDDPDAAWYVRPDSGGQFGPAGATVLAEWISQGRLSKTTLVWRDGWAQWRDAVEVFAEIADQLPDPPPHLPDPRETSTESVTSQRSADAPVQTDAQSVWDQPIAIDGSTSVGKVRRGRADKRVMSIGVLAGICAGLLAVLAYLVLR